MMTTLLLSSTLNLMGLPLLALFSLLLPLL
jgi:hypothetical protein